MNLEDVSNLAAPFGLFVMGARHGTRSDTGDAGETLVLLGAGSDCWAHFTAASEYQDKRPNPLDRWSKRVIGEIAQTLGAATAFPSDGPPYAPFIRWSLETGRFFQSPTGMMIHEDAGLMISIRGALWIDAVLDIPTAIAPSPCESCSDQPCTTACPVGALAATHAYDVPVCKSYLETDAGQDCMTQGCRVRRACPVSQRFGRNPEQSAFHMKAFKG